MGPQKGIKTGRIPYYRLPVPQVFLYEASRNRFHVIDGQQRLMSLYYFVENDFLGWRSGGIEAYFAEHGQIPDKIFQDNRYFTDFRLVLPERLSGVRNRLNGLSYDILDDYELSFNLRTIRNVIIRQNAPKMRIPPSTRYSAASIQEA